MLISLLFSVSLLPSTAGSRRDCGGQSKPQTQPKLYVVPFTEMADPPALPKVDLNSCPFEGCQFGKWIANKARRGSIQLGKRAKIVSKLQKGDEVTALTGINLTIKPAKGIFTQDSPMFGAKQG